MTLSAMSSWHLDSQKSCWQEAISNSYVERLHLINFNEKLETGPFLGLMGFFQSNISLAVEQSIFINLPSLFWIPSVPWTFRIYTSSVISFHIMWKRLHDSSILINFEVVFVYWRLKQGRQYNQKRNINATQIADERVKLRENIEFLALPHLLLLQLLKNVNLSQLRISTKFLPPNITYLLIGYLTAISKGCSMKLEIPAE